MTPADVPAVLERLREQNERDSTSYQCPMVFDSMGARLPSIPLALVVIDEDDRVLQGIVFEKTVEMMSFGINARASIAAMHEQEAIFYLLKERGYKDLHILVPNERVSQMEHGLDRILGMNRTTEVLTHFYRLIDQSENEDLRKWYATQEARHEPEPAASSH